MRRASDKPKGALDLSLQELNVIVNWTRYRTQEEPIYEFWSDNYKDQFGNYDTFLYDQESLTGRDYKLGSLGIVQGGHLNYLAVGMLAAHYGANHYQAIPAMVIAHNVGQAIGRKSIRDFKDIGPGIKWALFGAAQYNRGSQ